VSRAKSILITGASRGLGMLAAVELARRGHRVFAGVRTPAATPRLDEACARAGVQVTKLHLDVTDATTIANSVSEMMASEGAIDVLINNAGIVRVGFFETIQESHFQAVINTNFVGMCAVTRAAVPIMRRQGHGVILNMSSLYGLVGAAVSSAYAASKWAVEGWSESLRFELTPRNIYVSLIEAGHYATDLLHIDDASISELHNADSPYSLALGGMAEQYRKHIVTRARNPAIVARLMADVAEKDRPRLRYALGADTAIVRLLRALLPWSTFEALFVAIVKTWMKGPSRSKEPVVPALPRPSP
jgi:NAD(P)-dependent dehydrogenase (short-subunit alcohol dehydrogenase family)